MRKVFLSHSFADRDRTLVTQVEALLRSHDLVAVNGRTLGGGGLTPEIQARIDEADAMVALLTRRENDPRNITHPWVVQEFGHARLSGKRAIGIYERGVSQIEADEGFERIDHAPDDPLATFLRLSETIGAWKRAAGRFQKVMVMPDDVAKPLGARADQVRCQYRFQSEGNDTDWRDAKVRREVGGVFVYLRVPDDVDAVQIRVDGPPFVETPYTPLWYSARFDPRN